MSCSTDWLHNVECGTACHWQIGEDLEGDCCAGTEEVPAVGVCRQTLRARSVMVGNVTTSVRVAARPLCVMGRRNHMLIDLHVIATA
jgi:hypothetical protein